MAVTLSPYLGFRDNAREAMEFYHSVFGGELAVTTFGEFGMGGDDEAHLVMHSQLTVNDRIVFQGADTPADQPYEPGDTMTMSLWGGPDDDAQLRAWWNGLLDGGSVMMPLEVSPWNDTFGGLVDRYGVKWFVNIEAPQS